MRRIIRCGAFLIPLTLLTYTTAQAQELLPEETGQTEEVAQQGEDLFEVSLEDLLNLNMELSTGSFLELDRKSSAVSMTIITESQIENSGARHLSELLEIYVPGFQYMYNKWNGIIWGMRGVAADRNTKFIFLVNGHKMNHESRDGAMSELDLGLLGDIDRVEVLRGPAGLVYGSGAIAGVVNIVTKTYVANSGEITLGAQTWNMQSGGKTTEANVHREINENASVTINMGYRQSDGVGMEKSRIWGPASWPYPSDVTDGTVPPNGVPSGGSTWSTPGNGKVGIDFNYKNLRLYSRMTHQVTNAGGLFPVDAWPEIDGGYDPSGKVPADADSRFVDGDYRSYDSFYGKIETWGTNRRQYVIDNFSNELSYKHEIGENALNFKLGMDAVSNRIVKQDQKAYTSKNGVERTVPQDEVFGERRYNFSTMYQVKTIDRAQLAIGYEFKLFDIGKDMAGNNSVGGYPNHLVVDNVIYTNNAVFGEGVYKLSDKFNINAGVRYDAHTRTIKYGGVISPKLGLIFKANDKNTFKLVYQQSANNGSADNYEFGRNSMNNQGVKSTGDVYRYEKPYDKPGTGSAILPPVTASILQDLKPERAQSLELMTVHELGGGLVVMPSASWNLIKDLFVWNQDLFRVMNAGKYSFFNFDLETKYASTKLDVGFNHTLQMMANRSDINSGKTYKVKEFDGYTTSVDATGQTVYTPKAALDSLGNEVYTEKTLTPISTSVSSDGTNFLNLAKNVTKVYLDYKPTTWLTFHTNLRAFWGLNGRKSVYENSPHNSLNMWSSSSPILKWNMSLSIKPDENWKISLFVYDILASQSNPLASLRWQQRGDGGQNDLYGADFRSMAIMIDYKF